MAISDARSRQTTLIHLAGVEERGGRRATIHVVSDLDTANRALARARPYAKFKRADADGHVYVNAAHVAYIEAETQRVGLAPRRHGAWAANDLEQRLEERRARAR